MLPENYRLNINDTYAAEYEKHLKRLAILKIQIGVGKGLDPQHPVKIPKAYDQKGSPISWDTYPRSEVIKISEQEVESEERILKIIEGLFETT